VLHSTNEALKISEIRERVFKLNKIDESELSFVEKRQARESFYRHVKS
jgi:hypothetical protein